jgi:hypothetical protein
MEPSELIGFTIKHAEWKRRDVFCEPRVWLTLDDGRIVSIGAVWSGTEETDIDLEEESE